MAIRILSSNEEGANLTPNTSETSPSNEDVFNSTNNVNGNMGAFSRRYFHESERIAHSQTDQDMSRCLKSSLTLPVGLRPKLERDGIIPPTRLLYRSGGTVKVTRTAPCYSQGFTSPDQKMQSLRPAARDGSYLGVSGKHQCITLNDNSLEYLVPSTSTSPGDPPLIPVDRSASVDTNVSSDCKKSDLLSNEKLVDSNNNNDNNSVVQQVALCSGRGSEVGKSFKEIRDSFAFPPLARISLKKPKVEKQKLASKTHSMFTKKSEIKSTSSTAIDLSVAKNMETSRHDNLDVLIPVIANQSTSARSSRKLSRKSRMQARAHSECNFNREKVLSEVPGDKNNLAEPSPARSCSSPISDAPVNVEPPIERHEVASLRRDARLPVKKPSILYLPMDKVLRDPRRKFASSCTDLMQQSKFGRVEELINESLGGWCFLFQGVVASWAVFLLVDFFFAFCLVVGCWRWITFSFF